MLRRHPLLTLFGLVVMGAALFFGCGLKGGVITLPGGISADVEMMMHSLRGNSVALLPEDELKNRMQLPEGFDIEVWATGIPNARLLFASAAGDVLVSSPGEGKIFRVVRDEDRDGRPDRIETLLEGLDRPHGLAYHEGWLYIGEGDAISRVRFDVEEGSVSGAPAPIVEGLPNGGNHWTKTVHIGPDRQLYVTVGSSCNVCEERDPRRAAMLRYALDGSGETLHATGLRNAVDFAWHPLTGALYATDNGRDLLGDDFPPCELNEIVSGGFYGWPYINGRGEPDPDYGDEAPASVASAIDPAHALPAHSAPLGIAFYDGDAFPARYRNAAFVALHGSWNRSQKQGYEVVSIHVAPDGGVQRESFLSGFEVDEEVSGRPVGLAVGPDGELFISDDYTGSIYRVVYGEITSRGSAVIGSPAKRTSENTLASLTVAELRSSELRGAALWKTHACADCHVGGGGEGSGPPVLLSDLQARYDIESLQRFMKAPQPPMPVSDLTPAELRDLSIHLLQEFGDANAN